MEQRLHLHWDGLGGDLDNREPGGEVPESLHPNESEGCKNPEW